MNTREKTVHEMTLKSIGPFLAITFGLTWGIALLAILFPEQIYRFFGEFDTTNPLYILAVYGPAFAAVILVLHHYGLRGLYHYVRRLTLVRMPPGWWVFLVLGIPLHYYLGAMIMGTYPGPFPYTTWYFALPALLHMLLLGPVEEFGWRGIALPLLQRRFAPLWAGLIIGVVWGVWHLPAFFIGGTPHSEWMFLSFFVGVISLSVIMTALFNASRGSILIAGLFHFQINNPLWPDGKPWDVVLFTVTAVIIVGLYRQKMLSREDSITGVLMPDEAEETL